MSESKFGGELLIGGVIVVIIAVCALVKAIEELFKDLGKMCDAIGVFISSFFHMLVVVLEAAGLIVVIVFVTVGGIYFTYRYIKMVYQATELQESVRLMLNESVSELAHGNLKTENAIERRVATSERRVLAMEQRLEEALAKPELKPEPPPAARADSSSDRPANEQGSDSETTELENETKQDDQDEENQLDSIHNPY